MVRNQGSERFKSSLPQTGPQSSLLATTIRHACGTPPATNCSRLCHGHTVPLRHKHAADQPVGCPRFGTDEIHVPVHFRYDRAEWKPGAGSQCCKFFVCREFKGRSASRGYPDSRRHRACSDPGPPRETRSPCTNCAHKAAEPGPPQSPCGLT